MTDLSKLPWDECVLPRFRDQITYVESWKSSSCFECCEIHSADDGAIARQVFYNRKKWTFTEAMSLHEFEQVIAMCRQVEAFIKEHGG